MEEVESANSAAIESCYEVINLLSEPQIQNRYRNLGEQTGDAVHKFKKVVSLLNSSCGHARVRKSKKFQTLFPQNILLDNPICTTGDDHLKSPQLLRIKSVENSLLQEFGSTMTLGNPSLEYGKNLSCLDQQTPLPDYHFLHQQRIQLQHHHLKLQSEAMCKRSSSGISLNFDGPTCAPTMSSSRSFISSLSVERSSHHHKKRCSGSVKCGGNGRCHCAKKRSCISLYFRHFLWRLLLEIVSFKPFPFDYRKQRIKRSIKVPAISNKLADIPPDDYSWRKYGQKPIKGSPHPRYVLIAIHSAC